MEIGIFEGRLCDYTSCFCLHAAGGEYAVICGDGVVFDEDKPFSSIVRRKSDIIGVFKVISKVVLVVSVNEWVDEIKCKEVYP